MTIALRAFGQGLPPYQREYKFHPTRGWRADFAWPEYRLAVEVEGGVYEGGRHNRIEGYLKDIEKYNALIECGWRLLRFASPHITDTPAETIDQIRRVIEKSAPVD